MRMVDTKELSGALGLQPHRVRYLARNGTLPHIRVGGGPKSGYLFDVDACKHRLRVLMGLSEEEEEALDDDGYRGDGEGL
jgi:hypothetical protein